MLVQNWINLIHNSTLFLAIPNIELKDIVYIQDSKKILFQLSLSTPPTVYTTVKNNECSLIDKTNLGYIIEKKCFKISQFKN